MTTVKSLFFIQGDQLFHPQFLKDHQSDLFLMLEDREQLTSYKFHKHRQIFYLSSMRHYARELRQQDFNLVYLELADTRGLSFEKTLKRVLNESGLKKITSFEIEDKIIEKRLEEFCHKNNYKLEFKTTPLFLTSRTEFKNYIEKKPLPSAKDFYEQQRRKFKVLMSPQGEPLGGRFCFDDDVSLIWRNGEETPKIPISVRDDVDKQVIQLVENEFPSHPGDARTAWYPTTRSAAELALEDFCKYRLAEFGPYEETLEPKEDFLFHSVLGAHLNVGLLTPGQVMNAALEHSKEYPVSLNSLESFIRKILGNREYVRGIYQNFSGAQEQSNFWQHLRLPNKNWYSGNTGVPPLDEAIHKALRLAYNHQAERQKVICNMMNLSEIQPQLAHQWFMEMYLDSTPWALGPNVYGLGLQSDGGLFGGDLEIFNSSHWRKMAVCEKEDWNLEVDGLFWRFVDNHEDYFSKHPSLSVLASNLERLPADKKTKLWKAAKDFLERNTSYP